MSLTDDLSNYLDREGNALLPFDMILGLYRERDFYSRRLKPQDWDVILGEFPEFREAMYPTKFGDHRNLDQIIRDDSGFCLTREVIDDYLEQVVFGVDRAPPSVLEPTLPPELLQEVKDLLLPEWGQEEESILGWSYYHQDDDEDTSAEADVSEPVCVQPREYVFLCEEEDGVSEPVLEQVPENRVYGFGTVFGEETEPITSGGSPTCRYPTLGGQPGLLGDLFRGNVEVEYKVHFDGNYPVRLSHQADVLAATESGGRILLLVRSREHAANRIAPPKAIGLRKSLWCLGSRHIVWRDRITYTSYTGDWLYRNAQVVVFRPDRNTHLASLGGYYPVWEPSLDVGWG